MTGTGGRYAEHKRWSLDVPSNSQGGPKNLVAVCATLASQLATLAKNLEVRLLANHYLWNLLALVVAGAAFEGEEADRWLAHESLLRDQLDEQVLSDGADGYIPKPCTIKRVRETVNAAFGEVA